MEAEVPAYLSKKHQHTASETLCQGFVSLNGHMINYVRSLIQHVTTSVPDSVVYKELNH